MLLAYTGFCEMFLITSFILRPVYLIYEAGSLFKKNYCYYWNEFKRFHRKLVVEFSDYAFASCLSFVYF